MPKNQQLPEVTSLGNTLIDVSLRSITPSLMPFFEYDGVAWKLKEGTQPSHDEALDIIQETLNLKGATALLDDETSWLTGNLITEIRDKLEDKFDISLVQNITNLAESTIRNTESVFRGLGQDRVRGRTFSHHREVHFTPDLPHRKKILVLEQSKRLDLSIKDTKKLARLARTTGLDFITEDSDPMDVLNAINEKVQKEKCYILIKNGKATKKKETELTDELCSNATTILQISPEIELIKDVTKLTGE